MTPSGLGLSNRDLGWIVGFLEGEGYFGLGTTPRVVAAQKNLEPLRRLKRLLGGKILLWNSMSGVSVWGAYGTLARDIMHLVRPMMSRRRKSQIRSALQRPTSRTRSSTVKAP